MTFHGWRLSEINEMIPFERLIYIDMLQQHVKNDNDRKAEFEAQRRILTGQRQWTKTK
jgi:hypothetical protein